MCAALLSTSAYIESRGTGVEDVVEVEVEFVEVVVELALAAVLLGLVVAVGVVSSIVAAAAAAGCSRAIDMREALELESAEILLSIYQTLSLSLEGGAAPASQRASE